jgi:hypothetical protein
MSLYYQSEVKEYINISVLNYIINQQYKNIQILEYESILSIRSIRIYV